MALEGCSAGEAYEVLARRAAEADRTLMEECWNTLGKIRPGPLPAGRTPSSPAEKDSAANEPPTAGADETAAPRPGSARGALARAGARERGPASARTPAGGARASAAAQVLEGLGEALARVGGLQDLAQCLLDGLGEAVGADAVMIYSVMPAGELELTGHAGIAETAAACWSRLPPLSGVAVLEAIRTRRPVWLEDPERDGKRYLLIGGPAEPWRTRAWIPVIVGGAATTAIGILRTLEEPFTTGTRQLLCAAARLCAGRLRAFETPREEAVARQVRSVQRLFDALSGSAILLTPLRSPSGEVEDYRIDAAAPHSVDVLGRRGRELVGLRILECYPTLAGAELWHGYLHTLETGEPYEGPPFEYREVVSGVPESSTYSVRAARLGDGLVVSWNQHDDLARQERRLAHVQRLGNLGWADWDLTTDEINWSPQVYAIFDRDRALGPMTLEELPDALLPEDFPALAASVQGLLGEARPMDDRFRIMTPGGLKHVRIVAEAITDAAGTPVEIHGFFQDLTAQRQAELALIESERAMLTQQGVLRAERTLAARLQHALLPLPEHPLILADLRVDVAYLPAEGGISVGGDWYSAIELPDGSALFVVGDTVGHGIDAVATMAQLRFTAKGMVITGSSLTGALARLNALLLHTHDAHKTSATMVLARYYPGTRRLTWAQAGHPPPLLLRRGTARYLERPVGILLGATPQPAYAEAECRLEPGDHVLFYTDGLIERPREDLDKGFARFAEAARTELAEGSGSLWNLLSSMLEGERRDDVCLLDVHLSPEGGPGRGE
ncbi:SpoIIE family protein phosphatase [Streptomyces sp. GC420]|nr:SpoIIE family protein phosphatase [Streptomyces sp. GC420]